MLPPCSQPPSGWRVAAFASTADVVPPRSRYVFPLLPGNWQELGSALLPASSDFHSLPAYLDAEDPTRSTWCRMINHAEDDTSRNLLFQVDCVHGFVWFVATRPIAVGEELAFKCAKLARDVSALALPFPSLSVA